MMSDTCYRCGDPLDDKAEEIWEYKLCEFCAVIGKANIAEFVDRLILPEPEFNAWLKEDRKSDAIHNQG